MYIYVYNSKNPPQLTKPTTPFMTSLARNREYLFLLPWSLQYAAGTLKQQTCIHICIKFSHTKHFWWRFLSASELLVTLKSSSMLDYKRWARSW